MNLGRKVVWGQMEMAGDKRAPGKGEAADPARKEPYSLKEL